MNTQNSIEIDIERGINNNSQLQNRCISPRNTYQEREMLHQELQRQRIRNLQIDSITNIFICIGMVGACVIVTYFFVTGNYLIK